MKKECNKCNIVGEEGDFYQVLKRNKKTFYHICKKCCAEQKAQSKDYYRNWELKNKYNISLEDYQRESNIRNNRCDICSKIVKSLHVDHNHINQKVRGYLCGSCNRGLGLLQDNIHILENAISYLKHHAQ